MRVAVDCRYVRLERHDGISRFTASIVGELAERLDVVMLVSDTRQLAMLPDLPHRLIRSPTSVLEPLVARQVNRTGSEIVFSPLQTMGSAGRRYRLVLTVHDLIYYAHPTPPRDLPAFVRVLWRLYHLAWWPQRRLLNRADGVVVVSETTRALVERHRLTTRPVAVVPNAADAAPASLTETVAHREPPREKRLVYTGSFMPYKDVDTLVGALALLPEHRLTLISRVTDAERARLAALPGGDRIDFANGASDEEYRSALLAATALVTASRDEGFGIPVVEAMALGTPVVATDIPIFREISGGAALLAPAGDARAFAARIRELDDAGRWREASAAALERSRSYDWGRSADALAAFLERIADAGRP